MKRLALVLVFLGVLLTCQTAQAAVFRSGNNVSIPANQTFNDDLYVSGGTVTIDGRVNGDLTVAGGTVTINGAVQDDLMVAGGTVILNGAVNHTVRAAGGNLSINGKIAQDLVVGGGSVDVASGATIGRDAVLGAGSARLAGNIARRLYAGGGDITIDGRVGDDARLEVDQLRLTDRAVIGGDLTYASENRADIDPGAEIAGKTTFKKRAPRAQQTAGSKVAGFVLSFLAAYIFGVLLLLLFPARTVQIADTVTGLPWISLLLGFAILVGVPFVAVILLILLLTIPISLTIIGLYILGIYLAKVFVGLALGRLIIGYFKLRWGNYLALLIGLLIVMLLGLIPILGWLIKLLYVVFGLGAAVYVLYRTIAERRHPAEQAPETTA